MTKQYKKRELEMALYAPLIGAIQGGAREPKDIIRRIGLPASTVHSRLAKLRAEKILAIKSDGYVVLPGHELTEEQLSLSVPHQSTDAEPPELRRIINDLLALVDRVRAVAPLIVSPQDRMAIEAMRKAGVRIKM